MIRDIPVITVRVSLISIVEDVAAGLLEMWNSQARTKGVDKHQAVQLCFWDTLGRAYLQEVQRFLGQVKHFPRGMVF